MNDIAPEDLADRLFEAGEAPLVVDIRHTDEFEDWHIPGSENVDIYEALTEEADEAREELRALPDDRQIVTVCRAGVLSRDATALLEDLGYDARTLEDGMNGWSRVHRSAPVEADIDGTLHQVARPGKGCLSHILISDGEAAVFDPSHYHAEYEQRIAAFDATLSGVFDTHAHADHVSGGRELATRNGVPYHLHPADARAVDATPVADGQTHTVGSVAVEVVHTPGHSPGGVTYALGAAGEETAEETLLTGDTLFHDSVGRVELGVEAGIEETDVEDNAATLYESIQRLRERPGDPLVLPAHDPGTPDPPVTAHMSEVERRNEDLGRDRPAFIAALADDIPDHPPNFERVKRVNIGIETAPPEELSDLELGPNRCAAE